MIQEDVQVQPQKMTPQNHEEFDVIIIGAGPAGMSAAVCAARAQLKTLVIEKALPGGEISIGFKIDNLLGYPDGILGETLARQMEDHLFSYPIAYTSESVESIQDKDKPVKNVSTHFGNTYKTRTIIIAIGLEPKRLNEHFEQKFMGRGISYFAQCDVNYYQNQTVAVIGGGNCACYAADYLSQFVDRIHLIHRSDQIRAVKSLKERIMANPKIDIMWNSQLTDVFGLDKVEKIKVAHTQTNQHTWLDIKGVFVYVGRIPPKEVENFGVQVDEDGFILTDECMRTNVPGVYAAGDIRSKQIRQIATAISDGMIAGINAGRDISR